MTSEVLFTEAVSFDDEATITVSVDRATVERSMGGGHFKVDTITLTISTAVAVSFSLTIDEANELSRALAGATKALAKTRSRSSPASE